MAGRRKLPRNTSDKPLTAYFIDCGGTYRVWRDGWFNEQFAVLSHQEFVNLRGNLAILNVPLVDKTNEAETER